MSNPTPTAWITGASSGIGAALARGYSARGYRVILSGRDKARLAAVAAQCAGETLCLPFDAADIPAAQAAADKAWDWAAIAGGGIDVLVNNAGVSQRSLAIDTDFSVYRNMIGLDLLSPIAITQALLQRMCARKTGQIVMVSSLAGKIGSPLRTAYAAAKHGLVGYADSLRIEVAHHGVGVIVVLPGSIKTDVSRNALTSDGSARGASDDRIEQGIEPDDFTERYFAAIAEGEREIVITDFPDEKMAGEMRKTPEVVIDMLTKSFAEGYAASMGVHEKGGV